MNAKSAADQLLAEQRAYYGALAPEWNHISTRFFDGFTFGVGFVF